MTATSDRCDLPARLADEEHPGLHGQGIEAHLDPEDRRSVAQDSRRGKRPGASRFPVARAPFTPSTFMALNPSTLRTLS
jgi:hypothetical protein